MVREGTSGDCIEDKPKKKPKLGAPPQAAPDATKANLFIDIPDDDQLERAEALGVTRVFACRVNASHVRIALSYEGAKAGVEDAEVTSFFKREVLVDNLAEAELWASTAEKPTPKLPFSQRRSAARTKLFAQASKSTAAQTPTKRTIDLSASDPTPGQSQLGSGFFGFKDMVRSKRVLQMQRCFVDCVNPIRVDSTGQPDEDELDEDNMELPGSAAYMLSAARTEGPLRFEDWCEERKNTIKAWPLMGFSEFLSFCRHAIKVCSKSSKPAAIINTVALNELMDIAIRLHRHMTRLGTLGPSEMRFKARMFLHLQYATIRRVVFTSASAMAVFKEATEVFMTRLPRSAFAQSTTTASPCSIAGSAGGRTTLSPAKCPPAARRPPAFGMPQSGCYLCPATDHYCIDRTKHPLNANGKHAKVSAKTQTAILAHIDNSSMSAEWKTAEKARVRDFWARRCAP